MPAILSRGWVAIGFGSCIQIWHMSIQLGCFKIAHSKYMPLIFFKLTSTCPQNVEQSWYDFPSACSDPKGYGSNPPLTNHIFTLQIYLSTSSWIFWIIINLMFVSKPWRCIFCNQINQKRRVEHVYTCVCVCTTRYYIATDDIPPLNLLSGSYVIV